MSTTIYDRLPPVVKAYLAEVMKGKFNIDVKVVRKSDSWLMNLIGWIASKTRLNPRFKDDYFTTLGKTIYVPDKHLFMDEENLLSVIMHECLHIRDSRRLSVLYVLGYAGPQIFSLLTVLTIWNTWFLLFLLCLLPFPSVGRMIFEVRAYRVSILIAKLVHGYSDSDMNHIRTWIINQLSKSFYYFCWPFPKHLDSILKDETFMNHEDYVVITGFLKDHGYVTSLSTSPGNPSHG